MFSTRFPAIGLALLSSRFKIRHWIELKICVDREIDKLLPSGKLGQVGNIRLAEITAITRE